MKQNIGVIRFGGIALILSGILFLAQYLFLLPMPSPPLTDAELMAWLQNWRFNLSMADDLLFFAALLLIPSIVALYRLLVIVEPVKASLGCGLLAVVIPVHLFLVIILGRLVYPVYGLELSRDIYKLVLSIYHGGIHSVALILGAAAIVFRNQKKCNWQACSVFGIRNRDLGARHLLFLADWYSTDGCVPAVFLRLVGPARV
ncbi:hypothetical protein [Paenibacillus graminis]|uniref:hypothetical protein n=1 Tax=Paenibacillus graminis TaxID=189425 RepID=UPI002DBF8CF9|nr:hypothetical protein [Paenibacillus graminis]MEC0167986.1 hypothetical protein [Paenibacillus graminis]